MERPLHGGVLERVSGAGIRMDELISVIIPVYNVAEYLPQCLETVCGQTYKNLEIILVDDGSTDSSGRICDEWGQKDPRIRVIHKENGGVSSARNEGLRVASGEFIGFVDSDDWVEPDMYEKLAVSIRENQADVAMCGYVDYPYGTMDLPVYKGITAYPPCDYEGTVIHIYERNGYFTSIWNKLFQKSLIFNNGSPCFFCTSIAVGEDELWLSYILSKLGKASFLPEALYHYRVRLGSVTKFEKVTEKQLSVLKAKKMAMKNIPQTDRVQELARSVMYNDCFLMMITAYCTHDKKKKRLITKSLAPMRESWLKSKDAPFMRKVKVIILEIEMALGLPVDIVKTTNGIKRNRLQ